MTACSTSYSLDYYPSTVDVKIDYVLSDNLKIPKIKYPFISKKAKRLFNKLGLR